MALKCSFTGSQYDGSPVLGSKYALKKKLIPSLFHARSERSINSVRMKMTMPNMLSAHRTISTWKHRSANAEFPRDSKNFRTAETSGLGGSVACVSAGSRGSVWTCGCEFLI